MYMHGLGYAFTLTMAMDHRTMVAKKALLEPGVSVKNLGPATDGYNLTFARLEVTYANGETQQIEAASSDIEMVRQDPSFPRYLDAVLIQARIQTEEFKRSEDIRHQQQWDDTVAKVKGWVRKCLPF